MVRSNASAVLGAGQTRLSHPPTHAKFSESASATSGRNPEVDKSGVYLSPAGSFRKVWSFAAALGARFPVGARRTRFEWSLRGRPAPRPR